MPEVSHVYKEPASVLGGAPKTPEKFTGSQLPHSFKSKPPFLPEPRSETGQQVVTLLVDEVK